jgi:endonuclease/exonuclease/phosphatase family metal-dependent hydrolase
LLCTWNVENFFDDVDDPANPDPEEDWFGSNPSAVSHKVELLARALRSQNDGRGPDILVLVEVESRRAVELLRDALNNHLPVGLRYNGLIHRDNRAGRRIEPAVLTRLTVRADRTRAFGALRILEAHLEGPRGAPLIVLASHWTSRVRDGSAANRAAYADALYRETGAHVRVDPLADVVIAGDFNDEPGDPSLIDHLHAVADPERVRRSVETEGPLLLLDLTACLDRKRDGTYLYQGRWELLDHIVVSPGMLDPAGWSVRPDLVRTEHAPSSWLAHERRPRRFGGPSNPNARGPSDHFAVSVRLTEGPNRRRNGDR